MKPGEASPWPPSAWKKRTVVRMLPRYTTNITGLRHWCWGRSFTNESISACRMMDLVTRRRRRFCGAETAGMAGELMGSLRWILASLRGDHRQVLDDRAEGEGGYEGERAHHDHRAREKDYEKWRVRGQRPEPRRHGLLRGKSAGDRKRRHREPETREEHHDAERGVVEGRVGRKPREGAAVVVSGRGERVED